MVKEANFTYEVYNKAKFVRRPTKRPIEDPPNVLDVIEGDTVEIKPVPYNKRPTVLLLVDRKSRLRFLKLLPNKQGSIVFIVIINLFEYFKT